MADSYAGRMAAMANPYRYPMGPYQGFAAFGTVDPINRPVLQNPDGSYSTASSATRYDPRDGTAVIFPTVVGGKRLSTDEAWQRYLQTGEHMGKFRVGQPGQAEQPGMNFAPSDAYAQAVHDWQATHYTPQGKRLYPVK